MKLTFYKTVEEFDGPILDLWTDENGALWARKWCDHGISMLNKTSTARIRAYKAKKISMLQLMTEFVDTVMIQDLITQEIVPKKNSDLPKSYFPSEDAFYEESLAPEAE